MQCFRQLVFEIVDGTTGSTIHLHATRTRSTCLILTLRQLVMTMGTKAHQSVGPVFPCGAKMPSAWDTDTPYPLVIHVCTVKGVRAGRWMLSDNLHRSEPLWRHTSGCPAANQPQPLLTGKKRGAAAYFPTFCTLRYLISSILILC